MKELDIIHYIETPSLLGSADIHQFKSMVREFPFYQTAHFLLLKSLSTQDPDEFQRQLYESSVYISDRDLLFKFLNREFKLDKEETECQVEEVEEVEETQEPNTNVEEEKFVEPEKEGGHKLSEPVLLKDKNVKRKINNSFEGMGENISETLSSQIEFSIVKESDELEYPSEIYFIEEERSGKNNIITIDAYPKNSKKLKKKNEILQIDEVENDTIEKQKTTKISDTKERFELIETEEIGLQKENNSQQSKAGNYFDISEYADEKELEKTSVKGDLITKFIEENPRIEPIDANEEIKDISVESIKEDSNLLSETLIKVYIKQGLFEKAIESYKELSLKYPEKNTYFANQIEMLEEKINKQ